MPLTLKIKYFNTFILREEPTVTTTTVTAATVDGDGNLGASTAVTITSNGAIAANQVVHGPGINELTTVSSVSSTSLTLNEARKIEKGVTLTFSNASAYPAAGATQTADNEWHIEESRIKGGFNEKTLDFGVKAYAVDKKYNRNHRENAMIYSGIFNSRTSVNNTNQFSIGENITKAVDSIYGSIQKLYAEDTNLLIFQENKVSGALIDKDAIFTAEGGGLTTTAKIVIGQITPYLGEYGIGKNPESFAVYGFRKYFVDKDRSAVLRLSRDGLTEISSYGMKSFFRDNLRISNKIFGMYDMNSKNYVLSLHLNKKVDQNIQTHVSVIRAVVSAIGEGGEDDFLEEGVVKITIPDRNITVGMFVTKQGETSENNIVVTNIEEASKITFSTPFSDLQPGDILLFTLPQQFRKSVSTPVTDFKTLTFDDKVNGWSSFLTYKPNFGGSIASNFYTWNGGDLYKHYSNSNKNTFYGEFQPSTVTIISNQNPSLVKHYKTINYEGTNNWKVISMSSPADEDNNSNPYPLPGNITGRYIDNFGVLRFAGFTPLEKKYYANIIINDTSTITGISALTTTGLKGFFAEAILEHHPVHNNKKLDITKHAELFSVGFNYEQSLY